jgi:transcriptional regulator with XRE-family HTH domain
MVGEGSPRLYGHRFLALRRIHRLTQADLADRLGVTQSFMSYVEKGDKAAPASLVHAAADAYSLPFAFFEVQPSSLDGGIATFRKTSHVTVRDEARVTALYDEAARLFRVLSFDTNFREAELPDPADFQGDPEVVATWLREAAGLDADEPVMNVTRTLERFGIGVIDRLDDECHQGTHVAVSRPSPLNDRPVVALAEDVPGAVKRLTLLHEAYHLMADRDLTSAIGSTRSVEEKRAYRFAGAFLLPAEVARDRISESLNLHGYLPIKAEFGVSVAALIRRGLDLGLISDQRYRSLNIQLSSQGWKRNEPVDVADEKPLLIRQALSKAFGAQPFAKASHALGMSPEWIRRWTNSDDDRDTVPGNVVDFVAVRASRRTDSDG